MLKDDNFAFMREATEPLLVVEFETRQILAVSDSLTILFGSSSNGLVNVKLDSIIDVPGKGVDLGSFFETVEKRGLAKLVHVVLKSDKRHSLFLEIYASLLPDKNKKLVRIWVNDVTAREKTIAAYQKNELLKNRAEQLGKFGHWERDLQTNEGVWSDGTYSIFGLYPAEHEPSLETLRKIIEPEDRMIIPNAIEKAREGADDIDVQYRINRPDGEQRIIHSCARLFKDESTGNEKLVGTVLDITERKRAEESLLHYQCIVSSSNDMLALLDKNFVYLAVNESYVKAFGKTISEVVGNTVSKIRGNRQFETVIRPNAEKCLLGNEVHYENWVDFPIHGKRFMDIYYSPYYGPDNEIKGFVINGRDITERKQTEEALQKSEEKFQKAFESGRDPITISRLADGRIVEVNASFERALGYTRQEVIGKTPLELGIFKDPADREVYKKILQKESRVQDFELELCKKSGEILTCRFSAELIDLNGETCMLAIARDITERKRAEEALRDANERFRITFETANIAICLVDLDVRFQLVNEQMCIMFGYSKEEFESMTVKDITHPEDWDIGLQFLQRALSGESDVARYIKRYIHKDGHVFWAELSSTIVRDAQGNPLHFISYILDISGRIRNENAMQERKARLSLVKDIAMEITSDMSIEEVVRNSLRRINEMFPEYRVAFGAIFEENRYHCIASMQPSGMQSVEGLKIDLSRAVRFVENLIESRVAINDMKEDDIINPLRDIFLSVQVEAMLSTPVKHADGLKGALCLHAPFRHNWTDHEISTMAVVSRYLAVAVKNAQLTEEQIKTAVNLEETSEKLRTESQELTRKNIALNQILEHLGKKKQNNKEQISESVESLLMPIVKKLKARGGNLSTKDIALLENSLNSIVGKEINVFKKNLVKLSPRELDICELIREGKSSKEISSVLNVSTLTIHKHRESIRIKLQLKNRSTNLSSYLRTRDS